MTGRGGNCRAITEWITALGKRLLTGNGLSSTPAPVKIFEPRSNLQKLTDAWAYTHFLQAAAQATDKVDRFKYVIAWQVAGFRHVFDSWRKPFNPILGETWQGRNSCGDSVFVEQVSHHPPVAAFRMVGTGWRLWGSVEGSISIVVKHRGFKQMLKGARTLQFDDGDVIEFGEPPSYVTKGVTSSADLRADVCGHAVLQYPSAHLGAYMSFGPITHASEDVYGRTDTVTGYIAPLAADPDSGTGPASERNASADLPSLDMASTQHSSDSTPRSAMASHSAKASDSKHGHAEPPFRMRLFGGHHDGASSGAASDGGHTPRQSARGGGGVFKFVSAVGVSSWLHSSQGASDAAVAPPNAVATFRGSWLSHLDFERAAGGGGADCVWRVQATAGDRFEDVPEGERLETDASFRLDMRLLAAGDIAGAQAEKDRLENRQRKDRKLRPKTAR